MKYETNRYDLRHYTRRIIFITAIISFVMPFGFLPVIYYSMCNAPEQMKFFTWVSFVVWSLAAVIGIIITLVLVKPVQDYLIRLEGGATVIAREILPIANRNKNIPVYLGLMLLITFLIMQIILYIIFRLNACGPIGTSSMFVTTCSGGLSGPLCLYGTLYLVVSPTYNHFYQTCHEHNIVLPQKGAGLGTAILLPMLAISIAISVWMTMPGFHEGLFRIREAAGRGILYAHTSELRVILAAKGGKVAPDDLKPIADRITSSGQGTAFIADSKGDMLYNPGGVEIFNRRWESINASVRTAFGADKPGTIYENVHEQMICSTPLPGGLILGTAVRMADRLPSFMPFWIISLFLGMVVMFMVIYLGVAQVIAIVRPIAGTKEKMHDLSSGEGDLTSRLAVLSGDENGVLAAEFNSFMSKLDKIISRVRQAADTVNAATNEVLAESQMFSHTTQKDAAAIQQVAGTMEEMTSSIKLNADNAAAGRAMMNEMVRLAGESEQSAKDLENSMAAISEASTRIGDIIATVNEVAFQTNLLALNAAVEAARAGEHGKGFAEVAEEVRSLALRSVESVRDIKALIDDTVNKINAGDVMSKKTGSSLKQIISHIHDLTETMEDIALASSQQAGGVGEINQAIALVDESTQRNVTTMLQLSRNAESLNAEADTLLNVVRRFKVTEQDA